MAGQLAEKFTAIFGLSQLTCAKAGLCALACHTANADAFAIGRIQHHDATAFDRGHALQRVATSELDHIGDSSALRVALGKIDHAVRHVAAVNQGLLAWLGFDHPFGSFLLHLRPFLRAERHKLFKGKSAQ